TPPPEPTDSPPPTSGAPLSARGALRWAAAHPTARFAVVLIALAHAVMVMVMVMTPVHMEGHGDTLEFVGIVISLHVFGMYGLSPVFGLAIDRWGALTVAAVGLAIEGLSVVLGFLAAGGGSALMVAALILLGLGWSGCVLAGSALLASDVAAEVRVPLQGASDAAMNYAGAIGAALAGPLLAVGGFHAVNVVAGLVLLPAVLLWFPARRDRRGRALLAAP
ncbi:MAG TPA: MFS transporter, partial [Actinomycetaceae bacterium]|nr:MFS transporter [Actinomycetaceae bacterium]